MALTKASGVRLKQRIESGFVEKHQRGICRTLLWGNSGWLGCHEKEGAEKRSDTLAVMNSLPHVETWRAAMQECLDALPAGGRLIVGLLSKDHLQAAGGGAISTPGFVAVSFEELCEFTGNANASIVAVEPCGTLYWDGVPNLWQSGSLAGDTHTWRRYLSWLDKDDDLLALGAFLHETLLAHLGTTASERYMAVIEKDGKNSGEEPVRVRALNSLSPPLNHDALSALLPVPASEWASQLDRLASANLRCRMYLYRMLSALWKYEDGVDWKSLLSDGLTRDFANWREMELREERVMELVVSWHQLDIFREELTYQGMALGPGLEYQMFPILLGDYNLVFSGEKV
jgi:hypothetical protein